MVMLMIKTGLETACLAIFESVPVRFGLQEYVNDKTGIANTSLAIFESVPVRFDPLRSLWLIK